MPKSGSCEPEGQPAERKRQPAERQSPKRRQRRAVKTTQDERSPSAGRSRETRGRRSSADTPTNTIEKRDCDTLRPSEASQKVFHHSKSGASEGREEAKKSRKSLSQLGNKSRKVPNSAPNGQKASKSCEFPPSPPLVGSRGGRGRSSCSTLSTAVSPHTGARESNSPPPVRRFGTKRRFCLSVSAKMPTFAAAIPPQSTARQGSSGVFAAAEASFTTILKH